MLPVVLATSIKTDLRLTDSELGFLMGPAFAFFYTGMLGPLGWLADRMNRVHLLAACLGLWSLTAALSAVGRGFGFLSVMRFGTGTGEAGLTPVSYSLLADVFPKQRRSTMIGIYQLGAPAGQAVAFIGGGWFAYMIGWRMTFVVMAVPGLVLALIFLLTLREPLRGEVDGLTATGRADPMLSVLKVLWAARTYRWGLLGTLLSGLATVVTTQWASPYLARSFALNTAEIGVWMGPIAAIGGGVGTLFGAVLTDRFWMRRPQWVMLLPATALLLSSIPSYFAFSVASSRWALVLLIFPITLGAVKVMPFISLILALSPVRMRGSAPAISVMLLGITSFGLGPQLVGVLADLLTPAYGPRALGLVLAIFVPACSIAGMICFYVASRSVESDLADAELRELTASSPS